MDPMGIEVMIFHCHDAAGATPSHSLRYKASLYLGNKALLLMVQKSSDHQLRLVVYPIIYKVIYIPSGAGFLPSTVYVLRGY